MKLAIYLLPVMLLFFPSCDDDSEESRQYVLKTITITPPGITHTLHYDDRGRISEISNADDGWTGTTFSYDSKGNLSSGSNWYFTYDDADRLTRIVAGGRTDDLKYNSHGQLERVTTKFDAGGPIVTVSYVYRYPNTLTTNYSAVEYDYGPTEEVEYENYPNPFEHNWMQLGAAGFLAWDRFCYQTHNNIRRVSMIDGVNSIVYNYRYTYNEKRYPSKIVVETVVTTPEGTSTTESDPLTLTYTYR